MRTCQTRLFVALLSLIFGVLPALAQDDERLWLLMQINCLRQQVGSPPLVLNAILLQAADEQSENLAAAMLTDFHKGPDGSTPFVRAQRAGYTGISVGENVAGGLSVDTTFQWWLNSPIHYDNMTNAHWKDIGIGIASGPNGTWYTLVFGAVTWAVTDPVDIHPCLPTTPPASSPVPILAAVPTAIASETLISPTPFAADLNEDDLIRHVIQSGETPGTIILSYGFAWDQLPAIMALNEMTEDEARQLDVGDIFLLPPPGDMTVSATPVEPMPGLPVASDTPLPATDTPTLIASPTPVLATRISRAATAMPLATDALPATRVVLPTQTQSRPDTPLATPTPLLTSEPAADLPPPQNTITLLTVALLMPLIVVTVTVLRRARGG